jgi:hypothetical protein
MSKLSKLISRCRRKPTHTSNSLTDATYVVVVVVVIIIIIIYVCVVMMMMMMIMADHC